jgi:hypothetical protein
MSFEMTGQIVGVAFDYFSKKPTVTLTLNEESAAKAMVNELRTEGKLSIKIDKYREKRSINANAYAWKLMTEIGNVVRQSKEAVYFTMLQRYGQSDMVSIRDHINPADYFKYYEEVGEGTVRGKLFKHYRIYKGSSEFNTREMSIFLDGIIAEAKDLGIQTETPEQIAKMKSLWGE